MSVHHVIFVLILSPGNCSIVARKKPHIQQLKMR